MSSRLFAASLAIGSLLCVNGCGGSSGDAGPAGGTGGSSQSAAGPVEGNFDCVGENPGGGQYTGTVRIERDGELYRLTWTIAGHEHSGIGFMDGDRLCSSWAVRAEGAPDVAFVTHGLVVYKVAGDRLEGRYVEYPGDGIRTETLTRTGG